MDFNQLPAGFAMALARNFNALNTYSAMTEEQKRSILDRAHGAKSEQEMHEIINSLTRNSVQ